ncbi:MAG: energy transducer TonB [Bacteroidales bacterium]|nr:energy transducer TonB [Bacteroidales bacterium]
MANNLHDEKVISMLYGPILQSSISGKILAETTLESIPGVAGAKNPALKKGDVLSIIKYLPEEKKWLTKKEMNWGLVDAAFVMPLSENGIIPDFVPFDTPPQIAGMLEIEYPDEARQKNIEGKVIIKAFIDVKGKVKEAVVLKGIEELNEAALDAVKNGWYKPAKFREKPIGAWLTIPVKFRLSNDNM